MKLRRAAITTAALAAAATGAIAPAASATTTAPAHPAAPQRTAVACYLYVDDSRGYYNVRTAKSATAGLIKKYTGTRLPVWDRCGEELGGTYRCAVGEPQDRYYVAVNYNGRKGYVAAACAGGLGA
ncbi:hypothetical protein GCM10009577_35170 [Streptomyces javensis]|uniref:hypothetical protein n=1 Tax=Streptomyces javensis TaxID=114698 RepID=UPI0031DDC38E